eukprot:TRINITY_DN526_c0_g2_i3.p1 TRINITY_DN526_c0_g2~~TRINITY_DN526_c0_g2_i3.p1  ORF type:complete len:305 (-),score=94.09 TRINITY_DN526_c0_g2_i3:28-942(-)
MKQVFVLLLANFLLATLAEPGLNYASCQDEAGEGKCLDISPAAGHDYCDRLYGGYTYVENNCICDFPESTFGAIYYRTSEELICVYGNTEFDAVVQSLNGSGITYIGFEEDVQCELSYCEDNSNCFQAIDNSCDITFNLLVDIGANDGDSVNRTDTCEADLCLYEVDGTVLCGNASASVCDILNGTVVEECPIFTCDAGTIYTDANESTDVTGVPTSTDGGNTDSGNTDGGNTEITDGGIDDSTDSEEEGEGVEEGENTETENEDDVSASGSASDSGADSNDGDSPDGAIELVAGLVVVVGLFI